MKNEIEIKLPQKFSSINFKKFIQDFWVLDSSVFRVIINFHNTEWITNEGKVLLVSYLLILKKKGILIFIKAPCPVSTELDQKESKLLANDWKLNGLSELQVELKVDKYLKYKINRRVDFYRQYFINWDLLNEIGLSKKLFKLFFLLTFLCFR